MVLRSNFVISGQGDTPPMPERRDAASRFVHFASVEGHHERVRLPAGFPDDLAPWRNGKGCPESLAPAFMQPSLRRGKDERSGLDGTGPEEHVPMRFAGDPRERRRHRDEVCTGYG